MEREKPPNKNVGPVERARVAFYLSLGFTASSLVYPPAILGTIVTFPEMLRQWFLMDKDNNTTQR